MNEHVICQTRRSYVTKQGFSARYRIASNCVMSRHTEFNNIFDQFFQIQVQNVRLFFIEICGQIVIDEVSIYTIFACHGNIRYV